MAHSLDIHHAEMVNKMLSIGCIPIIFKQFNEKLQISEYNYFGEFSEKKVTVKSYLFKKIIKWMQLETITLSFKKTDMYYFQIGGS